jgi:VWFA-related protein
VAVEYFASVGEPGGAVSRPGAAPPAPPPAAPVHVVIWLDELHARTADRRQVFVTLGDTLKLLPPASRVMLVRYEGGADVLLPFNEKLDDVRKAIYEASVYMSSLRLIGERDWLEAQDAIRIDARPQDVGGPCLHGDQLARFYADRRRDDTLNALSSLERFLDSLRGITGRKAFFYVGDGLPLRPGEEAWNLYTELCGGQGVTRGDPDAMNTSELQEARFHRPDPGKVVFETMNTDIAGRWQRLAADANGQGVSFYALVPSTVRQSLGGNIDSVTNAVTTLASTTSAQSELEGVQLAADETGASVLYRGTALGAELTKSLSDLTRYYSLGFTPSGPESDRVRRLRVEVERPGVELRYRKSYARKSREQEVADRLLTRLLHGVGENTMGIKLSLAEAAAGAAAAADRRLRIDIPLRNLTLLPQGEQQRGLFAAYVVVKSKRGAISQVRRSTVPLSVGAAELVANPGREFRYEVSLPAKIELDGALIAVALRDELSGEVTFAAR